jgi:hypothetical protein
MARDTRRPIATTQPADINALIDRLAELVAEGHRMPIGGRIMIDAQEFTDTLDLMRLALPSELGQARRVVQDRQQVILDAQAEAERIVGIARDRANYMISEKGLMNEARALGDDYKRQSREQTRRTMSEIDSYALKVLDKVGAAIRGGLAEIEDVLGEIEEAKGQINQPGPRIDH